MTTIPDQIRQVESAIKLLTMQLSAGRARPEQLEPLREQLAKLKRGSVVIPNVTVKESPAKLRELAPPAMSHSEPRPVVDSYAERQATLTLEADVLRKEQAKLSNLLHKVPAHQDCPELTSRIVDLQVQIEDLWDEKKFIERNGVDAGGSFREAAPVVAPAARPLGDVQQKAVLTVELQRLREKRSKLSRKLENPKSADSKKAEWGTELAKVNSQIDQLTADRYVL
jgi:polyhydroxyalkanoate synthesis regulator phasin